MKPQKAALGTDEEEEEEEEHRKKRLSLSLSLSHSLAKYKGKGVDSVFAICSSTVRQCFLGNAWDRELLQTGSTSFHLFIDLSCFLLYMGK
jgi:hypothetical protein